MNDDLLELVATARLTRLIMDDGITQPLRDEINGRWPGKRISELLNCRACVSIWAAGAVVVLRCSRLGRAVLRMLALSEVAIALRAGAEWLERSSS